MAVKCQIEDRSTQGMVVMGIQVRGPDERPNAWFSPRAYTIQTGPQPTRRLLPTLYASENRIASGPDSRRDSEPVRRSLGRIIESGVLPVNSAETIERVPIHTDADGVVRVAGTRVTLDTIVAAFDAGATAEEIAQQYSSIPLADVYSVITYYLRHKTDVSAYLHRRQEQAATVREEVERRFPPSDIRERLIARRR